MAQSQMRSSGRLGCNTDETFVALAKENLMIDQVCIYSASL